MRYHLPGVMCAVPLIMKCYYWLTSREAASLEVCMRWEKEGKAHSQNLVPQVLLRKFAGLRPLI